MRLRLTQWVVVAGVAAILATVNGRAQQPPPAPLPDGPAVFKTATHAIRVVTLANGLANPWSIAFLPDGGLLVTERVGRLRVIRNGVLDPTPVAGVPEVHASQLDGLMDIALHPRFPENRFVYLTYAKPGPRVAAGAEVLASRVPELRRAGATGRTKTVALARGRWDGAALTDVRDIFVAEDWTDDSISQTAATRIAFGRDGMLYMGIGSPNAPAAIGPYARSRGGRAQDPGSHGGKVLRLRDDGGVPPDNPFVGRAGYKPEIYALGHRQPLGLTAHPQTGAIWEVENGPLDGDEVNIIKAGANYGWPLVGMGREYSGDFIGGVGSIGEAAGRRDASTMYMAGMEQPFIDWVPAVAPSGMTFYAGDRFPQWKGSLFIGVMKYRRLERHVFNDKGWPTRREYLLEDLKQRIRDVRAGPDGFLYVLTDQNPGAVLRIEPADIVTSGVTPPAGQIAGALQGGGRGRAGGAPEPPSNLPAAPTAVALPVLSAEVTGPGPIFDSAPSLAPGQGLAAFRYEVHEYFVSGTAAGAPYTTRLVVRRPADSSRFSGLVLAEAMHGSGAAHMFEFTSIYTMSSGHAAVEILTTPPAQFTALNEARYRSLSLTGAQTNEILAQVGSLVRSGTLLGGPVRKMVLAGTSMTAGVLINYLPAHMVYRTPQMQRIYDGFLPTSNGAMIREVDVPVIHVPTMHEVSGNVTNRQDGDEPGKQYRLYEFSGMGHIDTRDSVRLRPNPCVQPLSTFPVQAYMSVALDHLFKWVDAGTVPPRAARILLDRDQHNDGSNMALDGHGNPRGGIRTTYVDVPTATYVIRPAATTPVIPNAAEYIARGGQSAANLMCGLSTAQLAFAADKLRSLYTNTPGYVKAVEARLTALEREGWSLPVYREMILADAAKLTF